MAIPSGAALVAGTPPRAQRAEGWKGCSMAMRGGAQVFMKSDIRGARCLDRIQGGAGERPSGGGVVEERGGRVL